MSTACPHRLLRFSARAPAETALGRLLCTIEGQSGMRTARREWFRLAGPFQQGQAHKALHRPPVTRGRRGGLYHNGLTSTSGQRECRIRLRMMKLCACVRAAEVPAVVRMLPNNKGARRKTGPQVQESDSTVPKPYSSGPSHVDNLDRRVFFSLCWSISHTGRARRRSRALGADAYGRC